MTVTIPCPNCRRDMQLEQPPGASPELCERLAKLTVCDRCKPDWSRRVMRKPKVEAYEYRPPYKDA
jgi:hypothetical protein